MTLKRFIREGGELPRGYAVAYHDWCTARGVAYPLGFHLLVRWCRDLVCWLRVVGRPGYQEDIEMQAWQAGFAQGRIQRWRREGQS